MRITGGVFLNRTLLAPRGDAVRPTSDRMRQAIFNILVSGKFLQDVAFDLDGVMVLDGFCGTGALGIEAISRGAQGCIFIDRHRDSLACTRDNAAKLGLENDVWFLLKDSSCLPARPAGVPQAGLVFLDPPYRKGLIPQSLAALAAGGWMAPGALIVMESESKGIDGDLSALPVRVHDERPYGESLVRIATYDPDYDGNMPV